MDARKDESWTCGGALFYDVRHHRRKLTVAQLRTACLDRQGGWIVRMGFFWANPFAQVIALAFFLCVLKLGDCRWMLIQ